MHLTQPKICVDNGFHLHHMYTVIIIAIIIRHVENNKDDEKVKPQLKHRYRELTESWCTIYL